MPNLHQNMVNTQALFNMTTVTQETPWMHTSNKQIYILQFQSVSNLAILIISEASEIVSYMKSQSCASVQMYGMNFLNDSNNEEWR